MNNLIQERHNHSENCIKTILYRKRLKIEIYLEKERFGLTFFITELGNNLGSKVANEFGVTLREKRPHKKEVAHDIVGTQSLMIHRDLVEENIVGDTKAPLLFRFPSIFQTKAGDIITTCVYMNYQTFSNL